MMFITFCLIFGGYVLMKKYGVPIGEDGVLEDGTPTQEASDYVGSHMVFIALIVLAFGAVSDVVGWLS